MTMNLTGILGYLIFFGMICISILVFVIALLIKLIVKKHFVFRKLSMVSVVFMIIGLPGIYIAEKHYSHRFRQNLDDYYGWIALLIAVALSVFILLKKNPHPNS